MTNPIKRAAKVAARLVASSPPQAALIAWMARSGAGTNAALKRGALPLPVHFYSPVPDLGDLNRRQVWSRRSELPGVAFRPEAQVAYLLELGAKYGRECAWSAEPTDDPTAFHTENLSFSFGCAASAHCVIRDTKPRRLVEIGSGMSSKVLSAALKLNEDEDAQSAVYTIIDPYPSPVLQTLTGTRPHVVAKRVEDLDATFFEELERGDILFIDSGHVVRIGGDVNFLVLEVLPRLKAGVVVHFHDIGLPYEYPEVYLTNPGFRMLWTEAYLLQAFLACKRDFEVLLGMSYLMHDRLDAFQQAFPLYNATRHRAGSGSFWITRHAG